MIIQAYGLEALVAEKVFHLLLFPNIKKTCPQFSYSLLQSNALLGEVDPYGERYSDTYRREGRVGFKPI